MFAAPAHKLLMIPGPIEFDDEVLAAMATPGTSHVDPNFIAKFGNALEMLREVFFAPTGQPFIIAGSGTLTWDITGANLLQPNDPVLVISTGIFGEWFGECLSVYGGNVTFLRAPFGDAPTLEQIETALKSAPKPYRLVTVTHVDTSSGVLVDIQKVAGVIRRVSPSSLIALDGVCSVGAESIRQEEWGVDVVMTGSQKALGVPPGLAVMVLSQRALDVAINRPGPPTTYFGSLKKWLPIMKKYEARQPSYFATPAVQLILALQVSLKQIVEARGSLDARFASHVAASNKVKDTLEQFGLKIVPVKRDLAAHTLTAVYYPEGVVPGEFLGKVSGKGVLLAGGLHPEHAAKYFRIGHMNISATRDGSLGHLDKTLIAIKEALTEIGYKPKI